MSFDNAAMVALVKANFQRTQAVKLADIQSQITSACTAGAIQGLVEIPMTQAQSVALTTYLKNNGFKAWNEQTLDNVYRVGWQLDLDAVQ